MKLLPENINDTDDDDICKSFYLKIGNKVFDTIKSSRLKANSRINMSTTFHNKTVGRFIRKCRVSNQCCDILYLYILDKFLKYILNYRNKNFEKEEVMGKYESAKLGELEEQNQAMLLDLFCTNC